MKRYFISFLVLVFILFFAPARAEMTNLIFQWDANTESDLAGYRLYSSNISGSYNIGDPNSYIDITDPNASTYTLGYIPYGDINYFVLTAYDKGGNESDISNEVSYDLSPRKPSNFQIIIHIHTSGQ